MTRKPGASSASALLQHGLSRKQILHCLREELDLTDEEAELALSDADTPADGNPRVAPGRKGG